MPIVSRKSCEFLARGQFPDTCRVISAARCHPLAITRKSDAGDWQIVPEPHGGQPRVRLGWRCSLTYDRVRFALPSWGVEEQYQTNGCEQKSVAWGHGTDSWWLEMSLSISRDEAGKSYFF